MTSTTQTDPPEETQILKTDAKGRVLVPRERREQLLDEFERSGMSGNGFARRYGIKYPTFAYWRAQRRKQREAGSSGSSEPFLLVTSEVAASTENDGLEVKLPHGASLQIRSRSEAALAAELILFIQLICRKCFATCSV